ncbi:MAG: hypothetical protein CL940_07415 [Deltaproteobacteria bacterium]|nr:hypothetical protein [Deltaproteobacteria bacterium]
MVRYADLGFMFASDSMGLKAKHLGRLLCLVSMLLTVPAMGHPLKLSASVIHYDDARMALQMECKVFIDDLQLSLSNSILKDRDPNTVKREDRTALLEQYFQKFYIVKHEGRQLKWKVKVVRPLYRENVLVIRFEEIPARLQKGDRLTIINALFFRDFGPAQTNRTVVRIPSFNISDVHAATIRDPSRAYVLGTPKK